MTQPSSTDVARAIARRYCGWHVSPVSTDDEITLDGPGHRLLALPTLSLTAVGSVVEDGVELDLSTLAWSSAGVVVKRDGSAWTGQVGGITVTISHGYADAFDFDQAVSVIAESISSSDRNDPALVRKRIDDVEYQWSEAGGLPAAALPMLDRFRLEPSP